MKKPTITPKLTLEQANKLISMVLDTSTEPEQVRADVRYSTNEICSALGIEKKSQREISRWLGFLKVHGSQAFIDYFVYAKLPDYSYEEYLSFLAYAITTNTPIDRIWIIFKCSRTALENLSAQLKLGELDLSQVQPAVASADVVAAVNSVRDQGSAKGSNGANTTTKTTASKDQDRATADTAAQHDANTAQTAPAPQAKISAADNALLQFIRTLITPHTQAQALASNAAQSDLLQQKLRAGSHFLRLHERQLLEQWQPSTDLVALDMFKYHLTSRLIHENFNRLKLSEHDLGVAVDASGYYAPQSAGEVRAAASLIKKLLAGKLNYCEITLFDITANSDVLSTEQLHQCWLSLKDRLETATGNNNSLIAFLHKMLSSDACTPDNDNILLQDLNSGSEFLLPQEHQQLLDLMQHGTTNHIVLNSLKYQIVSRLIGENYHKLKLADENFGVEVDECGYYKPRNAGETRAAASFIKKMFAQNTFAGKLHSGEESLLTLAEKRDLLTPEQMHECWLSFQERRGSAAASTVPNPISASKSETGIESEVETSSKADAALIESTTTQEANSDQSNESNETNTSNQSAVETTELTDSIETADTYDKPEVEDLSSTLKWLYSASHEVTSTQDFAQRILATSPQLLLPKERLIFEYLATHTTTIPINLGNDLRYEFLAHLARDHHEELDSLAQSGVITWVDDLGFHTPLTGNDCKSALHWMLRNSLKTEVLADNISNDLITKLQQQAQDNSIESGAITTLWAEVKATWLGLVAGADTASATTATHTTNNADTSDHEDIDEEDDDDDLFSEIYGDDSFGDDDDDYFDEVDAQAYTEADSTINTKTQIDVSKIVRALDESYLLFLQEILLLGSGYPEAEILNESQPKEFAQWLLTAADTLLKPTEEQLLQQTITQGHSSFALTKLKYLLTARFIQQHKASLTERQTADTEKGKGDDAAALETSSTSTESVSTENSVTPQQASINGTPESTDKDLDGASVSDKQVMTTVHKLLSFSQQKIGSVEAYSVLHIADALLSADERAALKQIVRMAQQELQPAIDIKYKLIARLVSKYYNLLKKHDLGVAIDPCGYYTPRTLEENHAAAAMIVTKFKNELDTNELMFFKMAQINSGQDVDSHWQQIKNRVQSAAYQRLVTTHNQ